jgi:sugar phosphate isomerase/epimerase
MALLTVSAQLYTVRDLAAADFAGTLKRVAEVGYRAVELAGYGNLKTAAQAKKALDDAGLKVSGIHALLEVLESDASKVIDDAETLGTSAIICPWMPESRRKDAAGWKSVAVSFDRIGRACRERGFDFAYHNHSFEFQKFDGKTGLDILFGNTDPRLVKAEIDVYWVKHGGEDPVARINQLGPRVIALHLKDMTADDPSKFAEVGTGTLDFKAILGAALQQGVKWGIIEQDDTYGRPSLDSLRISFENFGKIQQT